MEKQPTGAKGGHHSLFKKEGVLINGRILDGAIYLYLPQMSLWGSYEKIAEDPLPFMIFLLKLLEWKKSLENT